MRFLKTLFGLTFSLSLLIAGSITLAPEPTVYAQTESPKNVVLNFFWENGCPHCAEEEKFLEKVQNDYPTLTINKFEIWGSAKNRELLKKVGQKLGADVNGVPFTVIGTNYIGGYYNEATTGAQIKEYLDYCLTTDCVDLVGQLNSTPSPTPTDSLDPQPPSQEPGPIVDNPQKDPWKDAPVSLPKEVNLPILGKINLTTLSLPAIAIIIGTLDGFNPCAMWVLLFLISLLVNLPNRNRRWLLGLTFLTVSGLVYFFFMSAWLNILLFIGFIVWIRLVIAVFAIIAGAFSLNKFLQHKMGCVVENDANRKKTFDRLKKITYDKSLLVALVGISALAFAVNLVELLCSAGFPAIFTQILALNNLPTTRYYLYIALYILFFMLDDIIIFVIAMRTLEATGISTKYAKYSNLIGGLLMLLIGTLLIFKPQYLMFNF